MLEQGLHSLLTADAGIASLVTAIYPVLVPEGAPDPCVSYSVVSGHSEYNLAGKSWTGVRIQFDAWSASYATVKSIQVALHNLLDAHQGALSDGTIIHMASRGTEIDFFESTSRRFRSITEYTFEYAE